MYYSNNTVSRVFLCYTYCHDGQHVKTAFRLLLLSAALALLAPWGGSAQENGPIGQQRDEAQKNAGKGAGPADHVTQPAPPAPAVNNAPAEPLRPECGPQTEQHEGQPKDWWRKFTTDPNATFAGLVAAFTAVLVGIGWWQGKQLRDTVRILQKTLDNTAKAQRAWIVPEEWLSGPKKVGPDKVSKQISFRPVPDTDSWLQIPFVNIGRVPAVDAGVILIPTLTRKDGSGAIARPQCVGWVRLVFGVDDAGDNNSLFHFRVGNQHDIAGLADESVILTVRVEITYKDPVLPEGFTAFTMTYHPGSGGFSGFFTSSGTFRSGDSVMR